MGQKPDNGVLAGVQETQWKLAGPGGNACGGGGAAKAQGASWWTWVAGRPRTLDLDGGKAGLANLKLEKEMRVFKCL